MKANQLPFAKHMPIILVALFVGGCAAPRMAQHDLSGGARARTLKKLHKEREGNKGRLKKMSTAQLAAALAADSRKGVESFNSMAYTEMISRGDQAAHNLAGHLSKGERSSLLGLLALRQLSMPEYNEMSSRLRVKVLVDSLRTAKKFNSWGLPHLFWEDAAKAIIAEGETAKPALIALLKDKRPAPVWGSEGAMEYVRYKYRVCDYAWALLNEIENRKLEIPEDPSDRDKLIEKGF